MCSISQNLLVQTQVEPSHLRLQQFLKDRAEQPARRRIHVSALVGETTICLPFHCQWTMALVLVQISRSEIVERHLELMPISAKSICQKLDATRPIVVLMHTSGLIKFAMIAGNR